MNKKNSSIYQEKNTLFQVDGYVMVVYNLGQQDIIVKDSSVRVNDGKYHDNNNRGLVT